MIKIRVKLFGAFKSPYGKDFEMELDRNTSIADFMIKKLKYKKKVVRYFTCVINGKTVDTDTILRRGNNLEIFLPLGGG